MKYFVITFVTICLLSTAIGWLAGFNFDHRGQDVAWWSIVTVAFAIFFGGAIADIHQHK